MELTLQIPRRTNRWSAPVGIGIGGAALGAALAYLLDPAQGARRRAGAQQKAIHAAKEIREAASVTSRDVAYRSRGLWAEALGDLSEIVARMRGEIPPDSVLAQRVRARLGRLCAHPSSIQIESREGRIRLAGPVFRAELDPILKGIARVRGVRDVESRLEAHETAGDIPGLQGEGPRIERPELLQQHWSPAARLLVGATGAGLLAFGGSRRGLLGAGAATAGMGLLLRSLTNLPMKRLVGFGAGRRAIDLQKDLFVDAPVEEVFAFFKRFENFPKFMSHVREVAPHGERERHWRWSVTGPAGVPVTWDAEVTEYASNQVIAWKSVAGSPVGHAGIVRFQPDRGGTRLSIQLSYNPPGGAIGHALISALGADPKKQLDDDLLRFKSLLETGKATGYEGTARKEEVAPESTAPSRTPLEPGPHVK